MKKLLKCFILIVWFTSIIWGFVLLFVQRGANFRDPISNNDCGSSKPPSKSSSDEIINKRMKIFCLVITYPNNHEKNAKAVNNTWGQHCDFLYFVSSASDTPDLNFIIYQTNNDSRSVLWGKTKLGFRYIHENYLEKADWFVKADDDTFLIVENLRLLLKEYNTDDPYWFGCRYWPYVKQGYMSGGGGYVLSRKAVKKFIEILDSKEEKKDCRSGNDDGAEDAEMGKCLQSANVTAGDSRDEIGEHRIIGLNPNNLVPPWPRDPEYWYFKNQFYPLGMAINCCSNMTIAFHYINAGDMYTIYFYIYKVKVSKLKFNNTES